MDTVYAWIVSLFAALWPFGDTVTDQGRFYGYVEGEYVYVAAQSSGILQTLDVTRGGTVSLNAPLFSLDSDKQLIALEKSKMSLAMARAQLDDESTGKRQPELAVIEEQLASAKAQLALAEATYKRSSELASLDFVATSRLDQDHASLEAAAAAVQEQIAQLEVARLPARTAKLQAAEESVKSAREDVLRAEIDLAERRVNAPADATVQQTYYLPGEYVPAGTPVVSLLPPGNVKFLFYVGEPQRAALEMGTPVLIGCDGCDRPVRAKIVYLSSSAQYTPPVIYSLEDRSKLVFMAEALPDEPTTLLPGQPIDVRVAQ
ncbi:MAG: HlyD family efflux transporter periplasmic adaptor subunit [Alphaproteobacteria bacterium]|nr:HlyD family efflux transporter periplasmic adaptor subunit [Alphaproteobacteria bacterium]